MSYLFASASSQYMEATGVDVTGYPFTLCCSFKVASVTGNNGICIGLFDKTSGWERANINPYEDDLYAQAAGDLSATAQNNVYTPYTASAWHTVVYSLASRTDRKLWVDGNLVSDADDTGDFTGFVSQMLGARWDSAGTSREFYFNGYLAEVGVYDIALDATDAASIAGGSSLRAVQRNSLVGYRSLETDVDTGFGVAYTNNGAVQDADHPTITIPSGNNKSTLTITGTHAEVVATVATLLYTPPPGYTGPDQLTMVTTDGAANTDTDVMAITISEAGGEVPEAMQRQSLQRRRRRR